MHALDPELHALCRMALCLASGHGAWQEAVEELIGADRVPKAKAIGAIKMGVVAAHKAYKPGAVIGHINGLIAYWIEGRGDSKRV